MSIVLEKEVKIHREDEKTNKYFNFEINSDCVELRIDYSLAPKVLEDKETGTKLAHECLLRDAGVYYSEYDKPESYLPLMNHITISLDSPTEYRGAAHRHDPVQHHIIRKDFASPGFNKGEIEKGIWKLCLNIHAVVSDEVICRFKIETIEDDKEQRLFPCELHCHTLHSDGGFTVQELLKTAEERKLKGICLTDHNTLSGHSEIGNTPLSVVKGIEWTTYFGHMLALDCKEFVDWRDAVPDNIDEKMLQVHAQNGLVGIAHPYQLGTPICTGGFWDYNIKDFSLVNYIEIWSEGNPFMNCANNRALSLWHSLLDKGFRITPTMGRDWHRATNNIYPSACTYLLCEGAILSEEKMKNAIKEGRTVISAGPEFIFKTEDGKTIGDEIEAGKLTLFFEINNNRVNEMKVDEVIVPQLIRIITNGGKVVKEFDSSVRSVEITMEKSSWYNVELWGTIDDEQRLIALTSPIYTK